MEFGPGNLPGRERGVRTAEPKPAEPKPAEGKPAEGRATDASEPREWFGGKRWLEWSRVTGDWSGVRTKLENAGLTFNGSWTYEWSSVWSGGLARRASTRSLLDFNTTLDLEKAVSLPGGSVFADFQSTDMRGGSEDSGDITGTTNIASGPNVHQLSELWYQQWLFDRSLRLKVGKVDAASEFAFSECAGDFQSSPSAGPATLYPTLPTYPNSATGVNLFVYPADKLYIGAGFYDGALAKGKPTGRLGPKTFFDGDAYFWIGEVGYAWGGGDTGAMRRRALAGLWHQTGDLDAFSGETTSGTSGFYLMGEQQVMRRDGAAADELKGLFVFGQASFGDERFNAVRFHGQLGVVAHGTFSGRDDDSAGVLVNFLDLSNEPGAGFSGNEWSWEAYYKYQLTGWASVSPAIQYITNPGGNPDTSHALVGQIRLLIAF